MTAINKGSAKAPIVTHLLRCLWFFCAYFNITLTASHIHGVANTLADQLSRNRMVDFSSHPMMLPHCLPRYHFLSSKLSHLKAQIGPLRPLAIIHSKHTTNTLIRGYRTQLTRHFQDLLQHGVRVLNCKRNMVVTMHIS